MHRKTLHTLTVIMLHLSAGAVSRAAMVINEVAFDEPPGSPDWVELYNPGPAEISINGWVLDDEDTAAGKEILLRLSTPVPAGAAVLVYVDAQGTGDTDFSDGRAVVYTGTSTTVNLAATEDELTLYFGAPQSSATVVDFLAWVADGHYDGLDKQANAVKAGKWTSGEAVIVKDTGSGYSIGRPEGGADTDHPADFVYFKKPTPGAANGMPASPEICGNGLDDDGDEKTDCADEDCGQAGACRSRARFGDVVINEVAWGGSAAGATHEWLEFHNTTAFAVYLNGWTLKSGEENINASLSGTLPAGGYYLLKRSTDAVIADVRADALYSGGLANAGEDLSLLDYEGTVVDVLPFAESGWPAGAGSPDFTSMERLDPLAEGRLAANWRSNNKVTRNGTDAKGGAVNGTPRRRNSVFGLHEPVDVESTEDKEEPSPSVLQIDGETNPFSPRDAEPQRRSARLRVNVHDPAVQKSMRVMDREGRTIRSLMGHDISFDGVSYAEKPAFTLLWDGRDDAGGLVPVGIYVVVLEGVHPANGDMLHARAVTVVGR